MDYFWWNRILWNCFGSWNFDIEEEKGFCKEKEKASSLELKSSGLVWPPISDFQIELKSGFVWPLISFAMYCILSLLDSCNWSPLKMTKPTLSDKNWFFGNRTMTKTYVSFQNFCDSRNLMLPLFTRCDASKVVDSIHCCNLRMGLYKQ